MIVEVKGGMVYPIRTEACNSTFKLPGGTESNDLPCRREGGKVFSYWECLNTEGLSFDRPEVSLFVWWRNEVNCTIRIGDADPHARDDLEMLPANDGVFEFIASLSEREAQVLRDGGHVEIMIEMDPPPPIAVCVG